MALGPLAGTSYTLVRRLGAGGSGEVFEAEHVALGKRVAVKLLRPDLAREPELLDRLRAEARLLARITHPALVSVYDLGETADGRAFFAMEFVDGENAAAIVKRHGPFAIDAACDLVAEVLDGLGAAHALGIIHCDVKPSNVVVGAGAGVGKPRIVDFGVAMAPGDPERDTIVLGTPSYMAPEQMRGQRVSPATDLYAAACTLFTLLTGSPPLENAFAGPAPLLSERLEGVSTELDALVAQALSPDPSERPRSAAVMAAELRRVAHPEGETREGPAARPTRANVRELPTRFLGRAHDLEVLGDLFAQRGARLVTLLGPGGAGKTRLSKRYATLHVSDHERAGGTWFVGLEDAKTALDVVTTLARVLGIALSSSSGDDDALLRDLGRVLHAHGAMLLVLDNCEQATVAIATVVQSMMELAPEARFLVTSRERLRIDGEQAYDVGPLPKEEAVALFVDRAQLVRPSWTPAAETPVVEEIVTLLDGLPLAIELGAARMGILSASALRDRLSQRFEVLSSTMANVSPRQRTLHAAIEWSWSLLDPFERSALAQCSVFRGGFTLEAAEAVLDLGAGAGAGVPALDVIQRLRDKSLIYAQPSRDFPSEIRLGLYESIREFAARSFDPSAANERHTRWFLEKGAEWLERFGSPEPLRRLSLEVENLRAVHARSLTHNAPDDALRAAAILLPFMRTRNVPLHVQRELADEALAGSDGADPGLVATVLYHRAFLFYWLGMGEEVRADADRMLEIAKRTKDRVAEARAHHCLTDFASIEERMAHATAAAKLIEGQGGDLEHDILLTLATARMDAGDLDAAHAMFTDLAARGDAANHRVRAGIARTNLAVLLMQRGELERAQSMLEDVLVSMHGYGFNLRAARYNMASVRHERGDREGAERDYRGLIADPGAGTLVAGMAKAALAVLFAERDDIDGSKRLLDEAESDLETAGDYAKIVAIHRGHLHLAQARRAARAGDAAGEKANRELAERVRDASSTLTVDDVHTARRWLDRALDPDASVDGWIVAGDGAWFRRPRGWRVEIGPRTHAKLVLAALLRARLAKPGEALSVDEVLHAGWPGERVLRRAAEARVYNIIKHLRTAGLRDLIASTPGGYVMDPVQRVIGA